MVEYDPQERELLKKIDFYLIPLLTLAMICYQADRFLVGQTRVARLDPLSGMEPDSELMDSQFDMVQIGYTLGFLLSALPMTLIARRFGPALVLAGLMFVWGLITLCMAGPLNVGGYTILRLLSGISQSSFLSGTLVYMIYFYTRHEIATRLAIVVGMALMLQSFSGVIAHWILQENPLGLPSWKILHLVQGSWTMILAGAIGFRLPNYPETTASLSPADRALAITRGRDGETHDVPQQPANVNAPLPPPLIIIDGYGLSGPLRDPALWLLSLSFFLAWIPLESLMALGSQIAATSFSLSPSTVQSALVYRNGTIHGAGIESLQINGMGSSLWGLLDGRVSASFLAFLPVLAGVCLSFLTARRTDEKGSRVHMASAGLALSVIGSLLLCLIPPSAPGGGPSRFLFGYVPAIIGLLVSLPIHLALSLDGVSGDCARCVRAALVLGPGLCASSTLWPTLLFPLVSAPGYSLGHLGLALMTLGSLLTLQSLRRWFTPGAGLDGDALWTVPPGLTRLLNDVEEGKAWETVELKTTAIRKTVQQVVLGKPKDDERASLSRSPIPPRSSSYNDQQEQPQWQRASPLDVNPISQRIEDDEEGFTNVY